MPEEKETKDAAIEAAMLRAMNAEIEADDKEPSPEERLAAMVAQATELEQKLRQAEEWAQAEEKQKLAALAQATARQGYVDDLAAKLKAANADLEGRGNELDNLTRLADERKASIKALEAEAEDLRKALKEEREIEDQLKEELAGEERARKSADKRALNWFRATLVAAVLATLAIMAVVVMVYYDTTSMSPEPTVSSEVIQEEPVVREFFPARVEEGEASVQKAQPAPAPTIKKSFGRNKGR